MSCRNMNLHVAFIREAIVALSKCLHLRLMCSQHRSSNFLGTSSFCRNEDILSRCSLLPHIWWGWLVLGNQWCQSTRIPGEKTGEDELFRNPRCLNFGLLGCTLGRKEVQNCRIVRALMRATLFFHSCSGYNLGMHLSGYYPLDRGELRGSSSLKISQKSKPNRRNTQKFQFAVQQKFF